MEKGKSLRLNVQQPSSDTGAQLISETPEPSSPQPSVDRLSVSFAPEGKPLTEEGDMHSSAGIPKPKPVSDTDKPPAPASPSDPSRKRSSANRLSVAMAGEDDDDDYSASITQILQRRASQRKAKGIGKRRTSSPLDGSDRRRSSVFTTSSGDTAITMDVDGSMGQEQIFENIRLHKEVLENVKNQPWEMRRKLKLVQQAKEYVRRHEGQLQERLAQSKNTKDIMARASIIFIRYYKYVKRELVNLATNMIPWEKRIKEIESHFGSVVASYFTFLRWIFWINIVIALTLVCFVIVPELLAADATAARNQRRKLPMKSEEKTAANLRTLWDFEGTLKYSPIFYGYYTDESETPNGYPLPLGYFITGLAVYVYSFIAILKRMAANSRQSKLSEKEDECIFSWKVFTGWDYMIGNPETAFNRFASITMGLKEALLEEKERKKDERNWKIISLRVLANFIVLLLLISSAWAVTLVVKRSETAEMQNITSWWRQNEITVVMSLITTIFPNIFELIGMMENYHPRRQLRWQLARIMVLNFLNLYTLIIALFGKVITMTNELEALRPNATMAASTITPLMASYPDTTIAPCGIVEVLNCSLLEDYHSKYAIKTSNSSITFTTNVMTLAPVNLTVLASLVNSSSHAHFNGVWKLLKEVSANGNLNQLINATLASPDLQEHLYELQENENLTYWSKDTDFNLNDSQILLPPNKTALSAALPVIIDLLRPYLLPNGLNSHTTPFYNAGNTTDFQPFPLFPENATFTDLTTPIPVKDTAYPRNFTLTSPFPFRNYYNFQTTAKPLRKRRRKHRSRNLPTSNPAFYYHTTDLSAESVSEPPDDEDYYEEYEDETSDNVLNLQTNGNYGHGVGKSQTRGDIPGETAGAEESTTAMILTTTEAPDVKLEQVLTQIVTVVKMFLSQNFTKYTAAEKISLQDFSKLVSSVFTQVDVYKSTPSTFNSTFGTSYKTKYQDKERKVCTVKVCEDGTTTPPGLLEAFNCTDVFCLLNQIAGPRDDGCWVENTKLCIQLTPPPTTANVTVENKLRRLCWETMFGQELVKLTVMDLIFTVVFILVIDFLRAILVRVLNPCWCWDLEKQFPQYGDFKIAENILHLVNNQGMIWMGMFFSPGLPTINLVKLVILMYIRSWAVMTCNVPHETVFRASRSNNFYFALLLFMLFLCTLPVGYAIVWLPPSWQCGPFSQYSRIFRIFTEALFRALPVRTHEAVEYMASPGIVIPLLVLLVLIIYYLLSLTGALREANNDLKSQLRRERTEERRKMFKIAGGKQKKEDTPFHKWKMILPQAQAVTSPDGQSQSRPLTGSILTTGKQTGFAGLAKRAALKARNASIPKPSDEEDGNATDVDQASLPDDHGKPEKKPPVPDRKPSCTDSFGSSRSEIPVIKISREEEQTLVAQPIAMTSASANEEEVKGPDKEKRTKVMKALLKAAKESGGSQSSDGKDKSD